MEKQEMTCSSCKGILTTVPSLNTYIQQTAVITKLLLLMLKENGKGV